jgi:hypothetical protein
VIVKPEKLVATAIGMLEEELIVPALFQREGYDQFKGAKDDTVSVAVEGVLPFHDYEWRSGSAGSTTPGTRQRVTFDEYAERKIAVTFGGNVYNGVRLTDEQSEMDLTGWGKLLRPQVKAVARGLSRRAVSTLESQTYNVTIGNAEGNLRGALVEARRVLNNFHAPDGDRILLVGSDFEAALLNDDKLSLAQNSGDDIAKTVMETATLGRRSGFRIVVDQTIAPTAAYAFASSAFVMVTGAPAVPGSVPFGATQSFEGYALRWLRDYDSEYFQDRSVVNTYAGFREVKDVLVGWDKVNETEIVSAGEHFVRGIKLNLTGPSDYPAAASELATITGVSDASVWTPTGRMTEADPANV